jgi:nucleoside-diphosphate-sugar epimerase
MKVFLTGATGFIGQALTRQLLGRGWEVNALVRRPQSPQAQSIQAMGAKLVEGDISKPDSMREAMQGADIVIHNAGVYELGLDAEGKKRMYEINVGGTENVLSLALELNIARVVYVSLALFFGRSDSAAAIDETARRETPVVSYYEETKIKAHEVALQYQAKGLPLIVACPNAVIGPNDHSAFGYFLRLYINKIMPPMAWGANNTFAFVHVDDLVEGLVLVAEKAPVGETYILAGEAIKMSDVFEIWRTKPGGLPVLFYLPISVATFMFTPLAPLLRMLNISPFLSGELVQLTSKSINTSSQKAKDELAWTYRSAKQLWLDVIDAELELRKKRTKRDIRSMLKPIESI